MYDRRHRLRRGRRYGAYSGGASGDLQKNTSEATRGVTVLDERVPNDVSLNLEDVTCSRNIQPTVADQKGLADYRERM